MRNFTFTTALLLCCLCWISVSGFGSQTVEVLPGEEVTLRCSNISTVPSQTDWFRVVNRTKPSCISSLLFSSDEAKFCNGFQNGYEMSSNISTVFLTIKQVNVSDSGLYFCGSYIKGHIVTSDATSLRVQEEPDGIVNLITVILGGLTVFLTVVVIALAVKFRKLHTAANEEMYAERNKNLGSHSLNSAVLRFLPETMRQRRSASDGRMETCVIYAASR
ncbi:uncharacterized protein [Pempheris klunzingeri]|uniref:uncharacterized protein n=1 Tax=Pempheris klunzingeri TaxID=3127111 RepID=UPI00398170B5